MLLVREHRAEFPSLTAAAAPVARQGRLGTETVPLGGAGRDRRRGQCRDRVELAHVERCGPACGRPGPGRRIRAAGTLASVFHARATTATIRDQLINVPARLARTARRLVLHLPRHWPWEAGWQQLQSTVTATGPPARA